MKVRIVSTILVILMSVLTAAASEKKSEKAEEIKGWLIDKCCSNTKNIEKHNRDCLLMESCANTGYGVRVEEKDGNYKFYKFDEKGQEIAKNIIKNSKKENNFKIVVKGDIEKNEIKVETIEEAAEEKK